MRDAIRLAAAYWAGIFALGFVLGSLRTLWLVPRIGELAAVALELPLMLGASWLWARRLLHGKAITPGQALAMGACAFALLMASEALLVTAMGEPIGQWIAGMGSPAGTLGLAGQIAFALIPWLAARTRAAGNRA